MDIGDKIKLIRKSEGLTQDDLGKKIGLSQHAITKYERGERIPNVEVILKLSEALNRPYEEIIKDTNVEHEENYNKIKNFLMFKKLDAMVAFKELIKYSGYIYEEYIEPSEGYDEFYISKLINGEKKTLHLSRKDMEYLLDESSELIKNLIEKFNGIPKNPLSEDL